MGGQSTSTTTTPPGTGGNVPPPGTSGCACSSELNAILSVLIGTNALGGSKAFTIVFGNVGTTGTRPFPAGTFVKKAVIQNLSNTDNLTVFFAPGATTFILAGNGTVLNPAPGAGQAGGSMTVGNIDLGDMSWITNTNTNQNVSVYYER